MRVLSAAIGAVAVLVFTISLAHAEVTRPMTSHPNSSDLETTCGHAGGHFNQDPPVEGMPGGYSCTKENCDGKGGECRVNCSDKGCAGTTPTILVNATLLMLLQNGSNVNHSYAKNEGSATPNHDAGGTTYPNIRNQVSPE